MADEVDVMKVVKVGGRHGGRSRGGGNGEACGIVVDRWVVKDGTDDGVGEPDFEVDVIKLNAYHVVLPACILASSDRAYMGVNVVGESTGESDLLASNGPETSGGVILRA